MQRAARKRMLALGERRTTQAGRKGKRIKEYLAAKIPSK